jgi:hypothetical protein
VQPSFNTDYVMRIDPTTGATVPFIRGDFNTFTSAQNPQFLRFAPAPVAGDYNGNGIVDAADYTVWRDTAGQTGANLAADGTGPSGTPDGIVDDLDYQFWVGHFGTTSPGVEALSAVPEPSTAMLSSLAIGCLWILGYRRRSG